MAYCEVLDSIDLRLMERTGESTLGGEHNGVFFTQEQLAAGLCFSVPALVKQFLYFTRAPPTLINPNVIRILIRCCVLNHLYQLDLSLVELCTIYFLRVGQGGRMSMSVMNPRLHVVNGLPDSPKSEAKGVLLVRGPGRVPRAPLVFRSTSTGLNLFQVCGQVKPGLIAFFRILVCDDGLTLGCSCG